MVKYERTAWSTGSGVRTGSGSLQQPAVCVYLARADFRERVKGPENRISVVADKAAARGADPGHDRSFWQHGVLAAGRHASSGCLLALTRQMKTGDIVPHAFGFCPRAS